MLTKYSSDSRAVPAESGDLDFNPNFRLVVRVMLRIQHPSKSDKLPFAFLVVKHSIYELDAANYQFRYLSKAKCFT